tara:strand:- start:166 stop:414 length:249 start_codon:yes stop_codon:yes gene_type:complete
MDAVELDRYRRSPFVSAEAFEDVAEANPQAFDELIDKDDLVKEYKELNKQLISITKKVDSVLFKLNARETTGSALQNFYEHE